jgi:hypothetical protein
MFEPKNNPAIPTEQKKIYAERMGPPRDPQQDMAKNQILNLQLYNPQKPRPDAPQFQPTSFFPSFNSNPFMPPQFGNMMGNPLMGMMYPTVNLNKIYDIKVGGPADTHTTLNMIYEDVLPTKHIKNSYITMSDRLTQSNYIRSVLFPNGDGSEIGFTQNSRNNILSHIKFLDLNPYNTYRFSDNPYRGLPEGFLIYRSCYPIQRDSKDGMAICARNSMAINLRVYRLTVRAFNINKQNKTNFADYNEWREVAWYEYVREHIIKKKLCPNFVTMHGYYTCENSEIDFDRVAKLRNYVRGQPPQPAPSKMLPLGNEYLQKQFEEQKKLTDAIAPYIVGGPITYKDPRFFPKEDTSQVNLDEYKGAVLAIMTESPTYTLYNWASKIYQLEGNIKKMVNTGYHTDKVWLSILFQLIVSLYVMQINKININNFSIKNNVFIKDISSEASVTNYWKYRINNIDFYVPNYGYLLQIDTNYSDMTDPQPATFINNQTKKHKLNGKIYDSNTDERQLYIDNFDNFISAMDTNNFKGDFISEGGVAPPQEVLSLMSKIHAEAVTKNQTNISFYLLSYMKQFMNNRIGTYLKEQEYVNVRKDDMRNVKSGQIVVLDEGNGTYRFVLYLITNNNVATIFTKDENINPDEIIEREVPVTSLFNYSRHEPILQNYKLNEANLTEEAVIETYTIIE